MANNQNVINLLNDLIQLDFDAVQAYGQAIDNIDDNTVRSRIQEFQRDHERHIRDLSDCVRDLGGTPAERKRDFKGFLLEGFTAIRSAIGTDGALKAMRSNEQLTNRSYDKALGENLPDKVREVVARNREDERRHLAYIEDVLDRKQHQESGVGAHGGM